MAKARRDPAIVAPVIAALEVLATIYARLKGDVSVLHAARENLFLPVDLVHPPTGTVIAVDGREHFTSFRLTALDSYPADVVVGFDLEEHRELCRTLSGETDALGRGLAAKGFGFGGVPRERAYHDALLRPRGPGDGPPAGRADRGGRRRRRGRLRAPPRRAAAARRIGRAPANVNGGWVGVGSKCRGAHFAA